MLYIYITNFDPPKGSSTACLLMAYRENRDAGLATTVDQAKAKRKGPQVFTCKHCKSAFSRGLDKKMHMMRCDKNPDAVTKKE
jgi:hypothetical protein